MPKKNQKAFQVVLAIVIALGLWLYVIGVENPAGTAHIRDVPIQLQGEQTLEDSGLMVTDLSRDGISVSLNGKKKTLMKISRKNLSLILDVSSVTEAGTWTLTGRLSYPATVNGESVTISRSLSPWSRRGRRRFPSGESSWAPRRRVIRRGPYP